MADTPSHQTHDPVNAEAGSQGFDRKAAGNGMLNASRIANRWLVAWRHILIVLLGILPGCRLKTRLTRFLLGMKIGNNVGIAGRVYFDPYAPSMIEIGDNVIIGFETKVFVHAFTLTRQRLRPVKIGSNVMIGGFCVVAPGVSIGDGASIAPGTIVSRNVPPGALVYGNVMRVRKRNAAIDHGEAGANHNQPHSTPRSA